MSRKRRTRLRLHDLGRLRRVDDRRQSRAERAAISFCLLFLEAPRGLGSVSARRPTRELQRRAAHAVSTMPAYESSRCGAGLRSVARHQARRGKLAFYGDQLRSERLARRVTYAWSSSRADVRCVRTETPASVERRASRFPRRVSATAQIRPRQLRHEPERYCSFCRGWPSRRSPRRAAAAVSQRAGWTRSGPVMTAS
jgi:hypothetical protein